MNFTCTGCETGTGAVTPSGEVVMLGGFMNWKEMGVRTIVAYLVAVKIGETVNLEPMVALEVMLPPICVGSLNKDLNISI